MQTTLSAKTTMCILGGDMRREEQEGKFDLGFTAPPGNFPPLPPDDLGILYAGRKSFDDDRRSGPRKKILYDRTALFFSRETDS